MGGDIDHVKQFSRATRCVGISLPVVPDGQVAARSPVISLRLDRFRHLQRSMRQLCAATLSPHFWGPH